MRITEGIEGGMSPCKNKINVWCSLCIFPKDLKRNKITIDNYKLLISKIETESLKSFKIYPHWGKINNFNKEKFKYIYGNNLNQFFIYKKEIDPSGIFNNDFVNLLF